MCLVFVEADYLVAVTDNLVSDMISTVEAESPDILLLGAGPRCEWRFSYRLFYGANIGKKQVSYNIFL